LATVHEQLVDALHEINRRMGKYARDVLAEHEMPLSLLMISKHIKVEPGITISEMARRTGIAKSHVSNQIRRLEARGWVEKRSDNEDQRILRLYLSESGVRELALIGTKIRKQFNALVADIPEARAEELLADLAEIRQAMLRNGEHNCPVHGPGNRGESTC